MPDAPIASEEEASNLPVDPEVDLVTVWKVQAYTHLEGKISRQYENMAEARDWMRELLRQKQPPYNLTLDVATVSRAAFASVTLEGAA